MVSWSEAIEIPAGRPYAMAAWRTHIWLNSPHRPLATGDSFPLTLDFGDLGRTEVTAIVETSPGR